MLDDLPAFLSWILARHAALGALTEIRILRKAGRGEKGTWAGLFEPDDLEPLFALLQSPAGGPREKLPRGSHPRIGEANIYFSLQGVDPELASGPRGKIEKVKTTTKDREILVYTCFVVDIDPERPSQTSATDEEKAASLEVAEAVRAWLEAFGIAVMVADSGNGYHLLIPLVPYRGEAVTQAADDAHTLLKLLHARFSTDRAKVDVSTFNPSRILKLYGTIAVKGEASVERPHRPASIDLSHVPDDIDLFSRLSAELEHFREEQKPSKPAKLEPPSLPEREDALGRDDVWKRWREEALAALPLEQVYGELLTGRMSGNGWLQARDPDSPSGDKHPSAGVADGTGEALRGTFHSFRTSESVSLFDFLIQSGQASDFRAALRLVADLSGVPFPKPLRGGSSRAQGLTLEHFMEQWKAAAGKTAPEEAARKVLLETYLKQLVGLPTLEAELALQPLSEVTGLSRAALKRGIKEIKGRQRVEPPPQSQRAVRPYIDYVLNRDEVGDLFDRVVDTIRPTDRFFRTADDNVFVRIGIGTASLKEANLPGYLAAFAELRFFIDTEEGPMLKRCGVLPGDLARAFVHDPRVRSRMKLLTTYCRSPVVSRDWRFIGTPGYHRDDDGIFYDGPEVGPQAEGTPRLEELLKGFCWKSDADAVNFLGVLLTALTMPHWGRGHPFLAINGNKPGVGKSTLARVLGVVVEGTIPPTISWTPNDEEFEKQLATRVDAGDRVIIIDNAKARGVIHSAVLERSITDARLNFRRLGSNTSISRPQNDLLFCLTMNMTQLGGDLRRRALPVNLVLEEDVRTVRYPIEDIVGFTQTHRLILLSELAGMVVRWTEGGQPTYEDPPGHSANQVWARTIDAILSFNGYHGFLSNLEESMHAFDPDYERILEICRSHADRPASTAGEWAAALKESVMEDRFKDSRGNFKSARSMAIIMGNLFQAYLDTTLEVDGVRYRLIRHQERGATHSGTYRFERLP